MIDSSLGKFTCYSSSRVRNTEQDSDQIIDTKKVLLIIRTIYTFISCTYTFMYKMDNYNKSNLLKKWIQAALVK